jgi:4-oxalmesaconate hydratase
MPKVADLKISDDELRESIETNQLRLMKERGSDITCFRRAPASWPTTLATSMCPAPGRPSATSCAYRVSQLFPDHFVPVAMLPQSPGRGPGHLHPRAGKVRQGIRRVGINLNPDPSGGHWTSPPLTDKHWYPIYEKMVEYDLPAMIHVSAPAATRASTPPARIT